jgi:hypothetical protein
MTQDNSYSWVFIPTSGKFSVKNLGFASPSKTTKPANWIPQVVD